jgi:ribonuclease J
MSRATANLDRRVSHASKSPATDGDHRRVVLGPIQWDPPEGRCCHRQAPTYGPDNGHFSNRPGVVKTESEIEQDFAGLFERTEGRVFVAWSGQNIDHTVTIYRAAKRTGRTLAIDLYTADVLDRIAQGTGLPRAGFPNLKVVVTGGLASNYRKQGCEDFVVRMAANGISAKRLEGSRHVVMLRRGLIRDYQRAGVVPTADDAFNFSMWRGYLSDP